MTPEEVLKLAKDQNCELVDFRFCDLFNTWHHITSPVSTLADYLEGVPFDGSSIRGWQTIDSSDMRLVPDPATAKVDPFAKHKTLVLLGGIVDPVTGEDYTRDPRNVAKKAEAYLNSTGIADTAYFAPEAEFFIFDDVRYDYSESGSFVSLVSGESPWTTGHEVEGGNLAYKIRAKSGYFPTLPADSNADIRDEMIITLEKMGLEVERAHHEVSPAQHEINYKFDTLQKASDDLQWYKYILRNIAHQHGKTLTFMPKPVFNDNGSGMHTHQSLWKDGKPLFAGSGYGGLSEMALHYIGGILKHAPAIAAFTNPLTNSYKRLVPGFEAPINLAYSARNRSATIRIPVADAPAAKRIEFRCPDSGANAYLAFSVMMLAGLDGIQNKLSPGEPMDVNIYDLPANELNKIGKMPGSLDEALDALEKDHDFLLKGNVFTQDLIDTWLDYKRTEELSPMNSRPHPFEYNLYFDY
ncbi:MAG: type I glutamate--ammonia ligase [SAR324 cluster bacterium]|nr:type I glutamate--ammonia ligase [SAR324 cluster bacterium]